MAKWIEWIEPYGPHNEPVYMRVTEATAIAAQRKAAEAKNFNYKSDAEALEDFITVNWAYIKEYD